MNETYVRDRFTHCSSNSNKYVSTDFYKCPVWRQLPQNTAMNSHMHKLSEPQLELPVRVCARSFTIHSNKSSPDVISLINWAEFLTPFSLLDAISVIKSSMHLSCSNNNAGNILLFYKLDTYTPNYWIQLVSINSCNEYIFEQTDFITVTKLIDDIIV